MKRSKDKHSRVIPLNDSTRAVLVRLTQGRAGSEYVFTAKANGVNNYSLRFGFGQVCERATIVKGMFKAAGLTWHDFRRTFATRLRASMVHEYDIQYLLGHTISGVTKTYARPSLANLRAAVNTLNEQWGKVILFNRKVS